jgi:thymidine kinase
MSGSLTLIIGPMYSSKTSELIRFKRRADVLNRKVLVINHEINKRYGTDKICSHDQVILDHNIVTKSLNDIKIKYKSDYENADLILIDELQFFQEEDAFNFITTSIDNDFKEIVCSSLNGDFQRKPFGVLPRLIPHVDHIIKLDALCKICMDGTLGQFSKRIIKKNNNNQILVGEHTEYIAVCRKHYLE